MLVEGPGKRSPELLTGRTCHNKRVVFPAHAAVPASLAAARAGALPSSSALDAELGPHAGLCPGLPGMPAGTGVQLVAGDYVAVEVLRAGVQSLGARPLARTTAAEFVARFGSTLPGGVVRGDLHVM